MEQPLDKIKLLDKGGRFTCVVLRDEEVIYTSEKKGVAPLKLFYETNGRMDDLIVIDRIMGKGAVILADLVGAKVIITPIISTSGLDYANSKNLNVHYLKEVDYIINRTKDGSCPIEAATKEVTNSLKGYQIIEETLNKF